MTQISKNYSFYIQGPLFIMIMETQHLNIKILEYLYLIYVFQASNNGINKVLNISKHLTTQLLKYKDNQDIIACLAVASLYLIFDNQTEIFKSHNWCFSNCGGSSGEANGYASDNQDCHNRCTANQGVSCGKNWQNCCNNGSCESHFYGDICNKRLPLANCTSP
ncbi:hypothetical protein pb186bvf_002790 [Paramecium bursaria]